MERSESKYFVTAGKMDEALVDLLGEKDFAYITVKEICARAGVNRSTFYLHYETIEDLLTECMEYLDRQFFSYFEENSGDFVRAIPSMKPEDLILVNRHYLIPYLSYIRDNLKVFQATLKHPEALQAEERYRRLNQYIVDPILERHGVPVEKRPFYKAYFLNGILAVIQEWIREECKQSPEEVSDIIEGLVVR